MNLHSGPQNLVDVEYCAVFGGLLNEGEGFDLLWIWSTSSKVLDVDHSVEIRREFAAT